MTRTEIEDKVIAIVEPQLQGTPLELDDVEYVQERDWYLRIDDCEQLSRSVEPILDELDFLKQAYYLEVSSPGLDRVLRREKDFVSYAGRLVDLKFFKPQAGAKQLTATLQGLRDGQVCVMVNGKDQSYPQEEVAQVRLHISLESTKK